MGMEGAGGGVGAKWTLSMALILLAISHLKSLKQNSPKSTAVLIYVHKAATTTQILI